EALCRRAELDHRLDDGFLRWGGTVKHIGVDIHSQPARGGIYLGQCSHSWRNIFIVLQAFRLVGQQIENLRLPKADNHWKIAGVCGEGRQHQHDRQRGAEHGGCRRWRECLETRSAKGRNRLMKLPHRRQFLHLAAGVATLPAFSRIASAQAYPARPVRILVGFTAGSGPDIVARLIGQWLSERLGQQVLIEDRPGGASNIATETVVRAAPDGYTLLLVTSGNAVNASLYDKLSFNFIRDIAPVAAITRTPHVMEVHPSFPAQTVPEFMAFAKANPGKVTLASAGNGSPGHLAGALLRMMVGIDLTHVPYRGASQAVTDLIGAQVDVAIVTLA